MTPRRLGWLAGWLPLAALLGVAAWFRITSLEGMFPLDGDEYFFGIQAARLVAGKSITTHTPTGNLVNPFLVLIEAPLIGLFGPRPWIVRVPSAAGGVLAVALLYALGRRSLDRATALIATTALAVLPRAILYARWGIEPSLLPLAAVLALHSALLPHRLGLVVAFVAGLLVHPTNLFLGPILLAVYLARAVPAAEPGRRLRTAAWAVAAAAAITLLFGLYSLGRPGSQSFYQSPCYHPAEWPRFLASIRSYLLGTPTYYATPIPASRLRRHDILFWGLGALVVGFGAVRLVRQRRWERLALVLALPLSLGVFHHMAGSDVLSGPLSRYGAFALVPCVVAFACLTRDLLFTAEEDGPVRARQLPAVLGLVLAGALLLAVKEQHFDAFTSTSGESLWTFRTEAPVAHQLAYQAILCDLDRAAPHALHGVIAWNWWTYRPLEFLATERKDLKVVPFYPLGARPAPPDLGRLLIRRLEAGDHAVCYEAEPFEGLLQSLIPPGQLEHREVRVPGHPVIKIFRLRPMAGGPTRVAADRTAPSAIGVVR